MELERLIERKEKALKNAEKFNDNKIKYNSFIKLSNNIEEEIKNFQKLNSIWNKLYISKNCSKSKRLRNI